METRVGIQKGMDTPDLRFWAKTNQQGEYHALLLHLLDSAAVAHQLSLSPRLSCEVEKWSNKVNLVPDKAPSMLAFITSLHDVGKLNPLFQKMDAAPQELKDFHGTLNDKLRHFRTLKLPHGLVTSTVLGNVLQSNGFKPDEQSMNRLAIVLGGHHGVFPTPGEINECRKKFKSIESNGKEWSRFRENYVEELVGILKPGKNLPSLAASDNSSAFWLAGFICLADWIASNTDFFGYQSDCSNIWDYWEEANRKAGLALKRIRWIGYSLYSDKKTFSQLFHFKPRPLQQIIEERINESELPEPSFVIIESPMGEGKTEAALLLQDYWRCQKQQTGAYFALPTMAASNQLYQRTHEFLRNRHPGESFDNLLLHSHALLNDEYQSMRTEAISQDVSDWEKNSSPIDWFVQPKRGLLAPFAVGTVDQALMSILQTKHGFLRLFGLSGKTIIFDEVHSYDAYMFSLFERLLQWLSALKCTVVILSATLPSETRRKMVNAFLGKEASIENESSYPRITITNSNDEVESIHIPVSNERKRTVGIEWLQDSNDAVADTLIEKLQGGGCAAVICNTVGRAQEVYLILKQRFADIDLDLGLFHARFPFYRRQQLEMECLAKYGKDSSKRPKKAILVATQVIEQSLDLDFDYMISEMAPADLLLQRSGRLQRHAQPGQIRPSTLQKPVIGIMKPKESAEGIDFGSSKWVYHEYILLRSWSALSEIDSINVPDDFERIIELVYDTESSNSEESKLREDYLESIHDFNNEASRVIIKEPGNSSALTAWCRELEEDNPLAHFSLQAKTRLSGPSVMIACLPREDEAFLLDEHSCKQPNAKSIMMNACAISHRSCLKDFPEKMIPNAWKRSRILRYCRAVFFDENKAEINGKTFINHPELGLFFESTSTGGQDEQF